MDMIGHQAEGMQPKVELLTVVCQSVQISLAIRILHEDRLLLINTRHHVVHRFREFQSQTP